MRVRSFLPFHCAFGPSISFLPRTLSGRTLPLEAQAVGGVESIGLEKKDGNSVFYRPSFHHGSQEQEFSGTLGVWKIQGLPSILGWYIKLLSVLSASCHCLSFFFFFFLIFGCAGSSLLSGLFSSCGKQGLCYSCGVRVSHCSGFSCCRAGALGPLGFSSCRSWALEHRLDSCDTQA